MTRSACQCGRRSLILGGLAALVGAPRNFAAMPTTAAPDAIDIHHHAIPDFWFAAAEAAVRAQVGGRIGPQWRGWTPETSLQAMDRQGVAMALLSISAPGTWLGEVAPARTLTRRCNEHLAGIVRDRPNRFGFHAALALPDVEGSLREIDHALDVLKADGVGLMTSYGGKYLGDPQFTPVFEKLNARKAVIYVHPVAPACCTALTPSVSPNFLEFLHDTNRAVLSLMFSGTLRRFPDLTFIFSHAGGTLPMMAGRISGLVAAYPEAAAGAPDGLAAEFRRLYFDVANSTSKATFGAMAELVPLTQAVLGSDFPIVPYEATTRGLGALGLPGDTLRAVRRDNALRLYPHLSARMGG
jgi:predicted TIM-barrel fold metal-dependent hydrolase